ncbi:MAG: sulfatase-like hydrolase/transferase, partial [Acidobacteriota bacterium]|nr:sulfatase-like hydrolase/transferase [Acidobacteriota bacterium]
MAGAATVAMLAVWRFAPRPVPHVLLITLDTTRADHLGCYGSDRAQTPHLDALAAAGVVFERAISVAPLTLPAHASLFSGLYPAETGLFTNARGRLPDSVPTLAELLKRRGYDTGGFVG